MPWTPRMFSHRKSGECVCILLCASLTRLSSFKDGPLRFSCCTKLREVLRAPGVSSAAQWTVLYYLIDSNQAHCQGQKQCTAFMTTHTSNYVYTGQGFVLFLCELPCVHITSLASLCFFSVFLSISLRAKGKQTWN